MKSPLLVVTMGSMRGILTLLPMLLCACQQASLVDEGDRLFKFGRYTEALDAYRGARAAEEEVMLLDRRIDETKIRILAAYVRVELQLHHPLSGLEILKVAAQIRPGHPLLEELRLRSRRQIADDLSADGRVLLDADKPDAATARYLRALDWDSENTTAIEGLQLSRARSQVLEETGEEYFFIGLSELQGERQARALTAFRNATNYHGKSGRAAEQVAMLSRAIATHSLRAARVYASVGLAGPAILAARDANRLVPEDPAAAELVAALEIELEAAADLDSADISTRGGRLVRAQELLDEAAASDAAVFHNRGIDVGMAIANKSDQLDYLLARSCELDQQMMRAQELYRGILARNPEHILGDLSVRLNQVAAAIRSARALQQEAALARAAGELKRSEELLAESRLIARDLK